MRRIALVFMLFVSVAAIACSSRHIADLGALVADADFSDDAIVLPEIKLESADAEKVNAELYRLCKSWQDWRADGIKITSSYSSALRDGILSVLVTEVFDDGVFADSRYYSYMFDVESGRLLEYDEFLELYGISDDEAEFYVKQSIAQLALEWTDEDFMPYQTLRGALSQTLRNYTDSTETGIITYYFDEAGTPYITLMVVTPDGSFERAVALVPSPVVAPLLRGEWILDAGDKVHTLNFEDGGQLNITVTDARGVAVDAFTVRFTAEPDGTELLLHCTAGEQAFDVRLTGTFVFQFIALPDESAPIAPGEYTYKEPELEFDFYEMY